MILPAIPPFSRCLSTFLPSCPPHCCLPDLDLACHVTTCGFTWIIPFQSVMNAYRTVRCKSNFGEHEWRCTSHSRAQHGVYGVPQHVVLAVERYRKLVQSYSSYMTAALGNTSPLIFSSHEALLFLYRLPEFAPVASAELQSHVHSLSE